MGTLRNIPTVSYNSRFGNVGKVVWFEVTNIYNYFELSFSFQLQQLNETNIQIYNNVTGEIIWTANYPQDVDQEQFLENVRILYIPDATTPQPFAIINLPT